MEEQAKLQNENNNFKVQVEALQERADEAASLKAEVSVAGHAQDDATALSLGLMSWSWT